MMILRYNKIPLREDKQPMLTVRLMESTPDKVWTWNELSEYFTGNRNAHGYSPILSSNPDIFAHDQEQQVWCLHKNYKEHLFRKERMKKEETQKIAESLLRAVLYWTGYDKRVDRINLVGGARSTAKRRESGCRHRAGLRGSSNLFTGDTGGAAAHIVAVRASDDFADNSQYNLIYLREDVHARYDRNEAEIHAEGTGLRLVLKTSVLGLSEIMFQDLDPLEARQIQTRVIIENIRKKIQQTIPDWFDEAVGGVYSKLTLDKSIVS